MCGIHVAIRRKPTSDGALTPDLERSLRARGPDHFGQATRRLEPSRDNAHEHGVVLTFTSTVLSLRGDHIATQPLEDLASGSLLCWNGEAWYVDGDVVRANDGQAVFELLLGAGAGDAVLRVLRSIEGPFAFVYYDAPSGTLYFGRDRLGRRSLLMCHDGTGEGAVVISSIAEACDERWKEVEADGIYSMCLQRGACLAPYTPPMRHDWQPGTGDQFVSSIARFNTVQPTGGDSVLTASSPAVSALREQLEQSLQLRVLDIPRPPRTGEPGSPPDTRLAVLFSGGLDCTVLARMCHDIVPESHGIDLVNVAFENPRVAAQLRKVSANADVDVYEACPDRMTGRKSMDELQRVCPGRAWRFIAVNVPYADLVSHRPAIVQLIHPHNTEMDLSIACALYFAARGEGLVSPTGGGPDANSRTYLMKSAARVLLSGLGADELFGGYGRHAVAFKQRGYPGLIDELKLDVSRLGKRNLGRDDRVMANWGKEVRFPFLDERLVKWAVETPAWEKCDFDHGEEVSGVEAGKRLLRLLAVELGMEAVAREKKRAIQFGSRTAKMESGKVKGTTLLVR